MELAIISCIRRWHGLTYRNRLGSQVKRSSPAGYVFEKYVQRRGTPRGLKRAVADNRSNYHRVLAAARVQIECWRVLIVNQFQNAIKCLSAHQRTGYAIEPDLGLRIAVIGKFQIIHVLVAEHDRSPPVIGIWQGASAGLMLFQVVGVGGIQFACQDEA